MKKKPEKERIQVTAGIIEREGKILLARRNENAHVGGKWEFPGGKIESGEIPEECLKRELSEELGVQVSVGECIGTFVHEYEDRVVELIVYKVSLKSGEPRPLEHSELAWVNAEEVFTYDLAEADVAVAESLSKEKG